MIYTFGQPWYEYSWVFILGYHIIGVLTNLHMGFGIYHICTRSFVWAMVPCYLTGNEPFMLKALVVIYAWLFIIGQQIRGVSTNLHVGFEINHICTNSIVRAMMQCYFKGNEPFTLNAFMMTYSWVYIIGQHIIGVSSNLQVGFGLYHICTKPNVKENA